MSISEGKPMGSNRLDRPKITTSEAPPSQIEES